MNELGTIRYEIEPWSNRFKVVSQVWNHGMIGAPQWHKNQVAICNTIADAQILITKLESKSPV